MSKKIITHLALLLTMTTSLLSNSSAQQATETVVQQTLSVSHLFVDVAETDWYTKYIQRAYDAGLVTGKLEQNFDPDGKLTFQEFAVMLTNACYGQEVAIGKYLYDSGLITNGWGAPYTAILKDAYGTNYNYSSILNGLSNEGSTTRYQASYLMGMLLSTELSLDSTGDYAIVATSKFSDLSGSLNNTHQGLLGLTVSHGIMSGDSNTTFAGDEILTRGEACVILCALLDLNSTGKLDLDQYNSAQHDLLEFRYSSYLQEHYEKHGSTFSYTSQEYYLIGANLALKSSFALTKTQADGDTAYYLQDSNEFVVVSSDGYIRTYFLPSDGIDYFYRQ